MLFPLSFLLAKASLTCLEVYHEPYKIKKTKLECEILEKKLEEMNKEREKDNLEKIDQENIDRLIQDKKSVFANLLPGQLVKQIVIEGRLEGKITIHFDKYAEIEPKKPEPPTHSQ